MTSTIILSHSEHSEPSDRPEITILIDDDHDIVLRFSERSGDMTVILDQKQFLQLTQQCEILRGQL